MQAKLHPSSCFPPSPTPLILQNQLFLRYDSGTKKTSPLCLTLVGQNKSTYAAIAALLASRSSVAIDCINVFDIDDTKEGHCVLHDLQSMASLIGRNVHLQRVHSYWETRNSTVIIISTQHYRLENESLSQWLQSNASLIELIVSQLSRYSPQATLVIGTEPNELMTYVAWRVSKFPRERVFGLGASVRTAAMEETCSDPSYRCLFVGMESHGDQKRHRGQAYWTAAMVIVRIIQALLGGKEFQSNFAVNIAPVCPTHDIFLIYPTVLGSTHRGIQHWLRFSAADRKLQQLSFLAPYDRMQRQIYLSKSKD